MSRKPSAMIGMGVLRSSKGDLILERARYILSVKEAGITADILNAPEPWGFESWTIGAPVVLELADGRFWDCILTDHKGRLVNRGERGLYREERTTR